MKRWLAAAALCAPPAHAQDLPNVVNWRYDEDWSALRDRPAQASDPWWLAAKYVPLDKDGDVYLTTGVELRARREGYTDNEWGAADAPDNAYVWLRAMPYADLHVGAVRAFVQPIAAYAFDVRPAKGPVDQTGADWLQAFADVRLAFGGAAVTLRGGRAMVALGSERLVGTRYGPNVPQAFDGLRATGTLGGARVDILRLRPVQNGLGDFDDRTARTRRLSGVYGTAPLPLGSADLYYLDYANRAARFDQGAGREHRQTFGLRWFGTRGPWSWNWEAMIQRGRFAGAPIHAWSVASETAYRFSTLPLQPTLRIRADIISGDRNPADARLETFNPLFPKGRYFGELSPIGPYNLINVHPNLQFELGRGVALGLAGMRYWRQSRGDGVYGIPGNLLRSGRGSRARDVGDQVELLLEWQADSALAFSASASVFRAGRFLRDTGPARPIHMAAFETSYRF
ncbi:alginate export family protein [Sphingomonas sp. CJ20]